MPLLPNDAATRTSSWGLKAPNVIARAGASKASAGPGKPPFLLSSPARASLSPGPSAASFVRNPVFKLMANLWCAGLTGRYTHFVVLPGPPLRSSPGFNVSGCQPEADCPTAVPERLMQERGGEKVELSGLQFGHFHAQVHFDAAVGIAFSK